MKFNSKNMSVITIEVITMNGEKFLNGLWNNDIRVSSIRKKDSITIIIDIYEEDYEDVKKISKRCNGKMKILNRRGHIVKIRKIRKHISFCLGGLLFLSIIFLLSTRIWAIDIETEKNISPFEIRKMLINVGIKQGISKGSVDVYEIERALEDGNNEILWARARIEGSSLKIKIEEKINPPELVSLDEREIVATKDGEIKRVYTKAGTSAVVPGEIVKKGDVLIYPYDGTREEKFPSKAEGSVIANVFYERNLEVQISGKKAERTGRLEKDIYLNILGKKIYLKKAINSFENYDRIEDKNGVLQSISYYEIEEVEINLDKKQVVEESVKKLEELLIKDLSNDCKIVSKDYDVNSIGDGKINIISQFIVEENIAS